MNRRKFLAMGGTIGVGGLAGCTLFDSDEVDDTIEMKVESKWLRFEHQYATDPPDYSTGWIIDIYSDEAVLNQDIIKETELTEDDVGPNTKIVELPMPEIYAAFQRIDFGSIKRTFVSVSGELLSQDEVNDHDPDEEEIGHRTYLAPTEFFDHIDPGETHRFRVARSDDYYPFGESGRLIDVLE